MKKLIAALGLLGTLALVACSSSTGTLSRDPVSYLIISGVQDNLSATIDDQPPVALAPQSKPVSLQVSPGRHRIRIQRGQALLVDRVVLVSDLQTLEIPIP